MIGAASALPPTRLMRGRVRHHEFEAVARVLAEGPAPLLEPLPGVAERDRLHLALLIPHYRRGSGGHNLLFQILVRLERMGHTCSVWHVDPHDLQPEPAAVIRQGIIEHFAPIRAPLFKGFDAWYGADVAMATSWITAYYALALERCRSRVYLVNDHEPEFYPTSVESHFAAQSYGFGMPVIAGSPWLRDLMRNRYGAQATSFSYGVDHDVYRERPVARRRDTIAFYARVTTPRRGVSLGLLALQILKQRRPDLRVILFGDSQAPPTTFDYEHLGVVSPDHLSWLYSEATVGLCLSLTNYSLIPKEMLACGLPVVDLAGASAQSMFGPDGPVELSPPDPWKLASTIEHLLDDEPTWSNHSLKGKALVATHTWDTAAAEVATALRATLGQTPYA